MKEEQKGNTSKMAFSSYKMVLLLKNNNKLSFYRAPPTIAKC
jgi:hypothetical protein